MDANAHTIALHTEVPRSLLAELEGLVDRGWSRSLDEIVLEALWRYADSHRQELMDEHVREDVAWDSAGVTEAISELWAPMHRV